MINYNKNEPNFSVLISLLLQQHKFQVQSQHKYTIIIIIINIGAQFCATVKVHRAVISLCAQYFCTLSANVTSLSCCVHRMVTNVDFSLRHSRLANKNCIVLFHAAQTLNFCVGQRTSATPDARTAIVTVQQYL